MLDEMRDDVSLVRYDNVIRLSCKSALTFLRHTKTTYARKII